jgi:hypothetical protein
MRSVGLDLGSRKTAFCVVVDGKVIERGIVNRVDELERLLGPRSEPATIAIVACREAWHVHATLTEWGQKVLLVDTTRVKQLGIGANPLAAGSLPVSASGGTSPSSSRKTPSDRTPAAEKDREPAKRPLQVLDVGATSESCAVGAMGTRNRERGRGTRSGSPAPPAARPDRARQPSTGTRPPAPNAAIKRLGVEAVHRKWSARSEVSSLTLCSPGSTRSAPAPP